MAVGIITYHRTVITALQNINKNMNYNISFLTLPLKKPSSVCFYLLMVFKMQTFKDFHLKIPTSGTKTCLRRIVMKVNNKESSMSYNTGKMSLEINAL